MRYGGQKVIKPMPSAMYGRFGARSLGALGNRRIVFTAPAPPYSPMAVKALDGPSDLLRILPHMG
jgi:hypothetical protein